MASNIFDDKPIWNALQIIEERVTGLEKDIDTIVNKTKDGFNHNEKTIKKIIEKINILCKRFGIRGL